MDKYRFKLNFNEFKVLARLINSPREYCVSICGEIGTDLLSNFFVSLVNEAANYMRKTNETFVVLVSWGELLNAIKLIKGGPYFLKWLKFNRESKLIYQKLCKFRDKIQPEADNQNYLEVLTNEEFFILKKLFGSPGARNFALSLSEEELSISKTLWGKVLDLRQKNPALYDSEK